MNGVWITLVAAGLLTGTRFLLMGIKAHRELATSLQQARVADGEGGIYQRINERVIRQLSRRRISMGLSLIVIAAIILWARI